MKPIIFTRKELYDLVWSKPITQLAKTYNISESFLRKICSENHIPLPMNGYWSKLKFSKEVVVFKLPEPDTYNQRIELNYQAKSKKLKVMDSGREGDTNVLLSDELEKYKLDGSMLRVPQKLRKPLPEIKVLEKEMSGKFVWDGWISSSRGMFGLRVSPSGLNRALRILNTLLVIFKQLNWQVDKSFGTTIIVDGEKVILSLREKRKRTLVVKENGWRETKYSPTGKFSITIGDYSRREFTDGKILLEEKLGEIVDYVAFKARKEKQQRLDWEIQRKRREEEELIKRKAKQRADEEFQNLMILRNRAFLWREAQNIRSYIANLETESNMTQEEIDYVSWAQQKADWLNPLMEQIDEFLSEDYKVKFLEFLIKGSR